jgi:catechol 2,3-dioxygenase-like lactoylglutathione lyase family enzyme
MADAPFAPRGVNHVALVCRDMARTVAFYQDVLGLPLMKTIELPAGMGQHFFFRCGERATIAFFWFPDAPAAAPGVASAPGRPDQGSLVSAHGSMNHLALDVDLDEIDACVARLRAAGVDCTEVANHDDSEWGISEQTHPGTFVRSIYFQDPDGILLELAAWTKEFAAEDVRHAPATASDLVEA